MSLVDFRFEYQITPTVKFFQTPSYELTRHLKVAEIEHINKIRSWKGCAQNHVSYNFFIFAHENKKIITCDVNVILIIKIIRATQ